MTDKKVLYSITSATLAVLLLAMLLPGEYSGRIVSAVILLPLSLVSWYFIKKRSIPSINYKEILLITAVMGVVYIVVFYLTGLKFGFYVNPYGLSLKNFFGFVVPITVIIISSELMRMVIRAQDDIIADRLF